MAFTAAQLEAILTLDKSQFDRALGQAQSTAQKTGQGFKDWGRGVGKAINDGIVLAATGAAGFAGAITNVGVEYNALQQRSRAALTTIMDGGEAANHQMDKLDDFASNSPFAREVFIRAQQQLLAFGMEAEDVVPTLSAIEDSVAATGGSSEDIAEIANILAIVTSSGKITADTLNQLGHRGIDAAQIIGDEMGKSADTIREEITAGSLDADEAIKALTDGMSDRFGGAAANVKETWDGATDRIRAATRDIGAEIARPFVDPHGGGRAIDWANDFADVLRAVERQVPDVVAVIDRKLEPAFDNFRITMKDAVEAIDNWDATEFETILENLSGHAPGIAGLSTAMFVMATSNIPVIGGLTSALGPLPAAIGAAALASPEMREGLKDILDAGKPLIDVIIDLAGVASGALTGGLELAGNALSFVSDVVGPVVEWFSGLPEPVRNAATAALIFNAAGGPTSTILSNITEGAKNLGGGIGGVMDTFGGWAGTFEGATGNMDDFRAAVGLVGEDLGKSATRGLRGAVNGIMGIFGGPWGIALMGATALLTHYAQEQAEAKARVDELASSLDDQTGAFTDNSRELVASEIMQSTSIDTLEDLGLTLNDVTDAVLNGGDSYDYFNAAVQAHSEEMEANGASLTDVQDKLHPLELAVRAEMEATQEAVEEKRQQIETQERLNSELDEGERSHRRMTESLAEAVDETINMNDRVKALNDALDELNGVVATQEERDRELAATQRDLGSWFADNAEAIGEMDEALIDMSDGIPSKTELGDQLNRMLQNMGEEAHKAALEARDVGEAAGDSSADIQAAVAEAYAPYIDTLQDLQDQGYLTQEEVDALTTSIIGVPEITSFLITHNESVTQTERDVLNLIAQVESVPDGDTYITDKGTSQDVIDELDDMGYEIENIGDGETKITAKGIPEAVSLIEDNLINRNWQTSVDVKLETPAAIGALGRQFFGNFHGGIDMMGMAAGGVTGASIMDIAQMVSPGDIRFAGDRSDVDEAWIPLDGSARSIAILEEAVRRMPGYEPAEAEGMAAGGVTGELTPPEVNAVGGPDTSELEKVWQEAMQVLEDSTRDSFAAIESDTASSQEATTSVTRANLSMMRDITAEQLALMVGATAVNMATMEDDTDRHTTGMRDTSAAQFAAMQSDGSNQTSTLRSNAAADFHALHTDGVAQTSALRSTAATNFLGMQTDGTHQTNTLRQNSWAQFQAMQVDGTHQTNTLRQNSWAQFQAMQVEGTNQTSALRSNALNQFSALRSGATNEASALRSASNREFTSLQTHGVAATADLRVGVVNEIGAARSPFTSRVNDLITVMRDFSDAMNDAYGEMGVEVGRPSRISAATGTILPGFNPGVDNHTFTSPTGGILELSGGEGVSRPEVVQAMGAGTFNALNAAARSGGVDGVRRMLGNVVPRQSFADGGIMDMFTEDAKAIGAEYKGLLPDNWIKPAGRSIIDTVVDGVGEALAAMFSGAGWVRPTTGRVTSRYGAGRGAYPHSGMDIADGHGTPTVAPTAGVVEETGWNIGPGRTGIGALVRHAANLFTYYGHNPVGGLKVKPGDLLAPGDRIGGQGNTGNSTGAHLHWEVHQGRKWADVNPHPYWDAAGTGGSAVTMPGGGSDAYAGIVAAALAAVGLPTTPRYIQAWLTQGQTESGLNPRARQRVNDINMRLGMPAQGIVQVIPPTFAAYSLPGMKDIYNPLHNFAAGMNYAKNRYGVAGMLGVIGHGHGYEHGTESALPGWAWVGEAGPELVNFGGGERVMPHRESVAATSGWRPTREDAKMFAREYAKLAPEGGHNFDITGPDPHAVADLVLQKLRTERALAAPMAPLA